MALAGQPEQRRGTRPAQATAGGQREYPVALDMNTQAVPVTSSGHPGRVHGLRFFTWCASSLVALALPVIRQIHR